MWAKPILRQVFEWLGESAMQLIPYIFREALIPPPGELWTIYGTHTLACAGRQFHCRAGSSIPVSDAAIIIIAIVICYTRFSFEPILVSSIKLRSVYLPTPPSVKTIF